MRGPLSIGWLKTGASRRSRANHSCGTPRSKVSRSRRSMSDKCTLIVFIYLSLFTGLVPVQGGLRSRSGCLSATEDQLAGVVDDVTLEPGSLPGEGLGDLQPPLLGQFDGGRVRHDVE